MLGEADETQKTRQNPEKWDHNSGLKKLSPDRLSGRNDFTLDKVSFRPVNRQNFFKKKKNRTSRFCVALKKSLSYCIVINIKLR